jgi:aminoglycoside 6'-N-acetyltransferase I
MSEQPAPASHSLSQLYAADRADHGDVPPVGTPAYAALRARDAARRAAALAALAALAEPSGQDLYHVAWLFNHGDSAGDARRAHEWAAAAAARGVAPAKWLAAASYDRWCMYEGRPQKYGTQFVPDGERYRLWDIEPGTTDDERAAWDVPPLAAQLERAAAMSRTEPQPPMEYAPEWLRQAVSRWRSAAAGPPGESPPRLSWRIVGLGRDSSALLPEAARLLVAEFREHWPEAWPTIEAAAEEVNEALAPDRVAFAAVGVDGEPLLGWVGALPAYRGRVWELHPLVVSHGVQGRGIGRALVRRLEQEVRGRGAQTLWVGTDDEAGLTSLGGVDLYPGLLDKLAKLENRRRHPLGFYRALGFELAGVVPDANGFGRPDILLAKRVSAAGPTPVQADARG